MTWGVGVVPKPMEGKPGATGDLAFLRRLYLQKQRASVALSRTLKPIEPKGCMSPRNLSLASFNLAIRPPRGQTRVRVSCP